MASWDILTLKGEESLAEKILEQADELFPHYPRDTSVRFISRRDRKGEIEISTRTDEEKFKDVVRQFTSVSTIAAHVEVNNTVEYGWCYVLEHQNGGVVQIEKISEPSPNYGRTATHKFQQEHDFHPGTSEFNIECWECITCMETLEVEDGDVHRHKVNDGHTDNDHDSDRYEIWEEYTFGNADKWREPSPDKVVQIHDTETGEIIKEVEGSTAPFSHDGVSKCSALISVLEGGSVKEAEL